jgi:DNA-binding NtrC family response regulator
MVRDFEQQVIAKALEAHSWNGVQTARALKISYRAFLYKVKEVRLSTSKSLVNTVNESVGV